MNPYMKRFYQFAGANLVGSIVYFLFSAILAGTGTTLPDAPSTRLLSAAVVTLPFLITTLILTLRDKTLPRRTTLSAYFADAGKIDLITFAVWALLGAMIAVAGEAASITIYLFVAQTLTCTTFMSLLGSGVGMIIATLLNILLYALARIAGILLRK